MYQKIILPYTLFLTYLPQAYSPLERSGLTDWLTDKVLHPLFPNSFFPRERVGPYKINPNGEQGTFVTQLLQKRRVSVLNLL